MGRIHQPKMNTQLNLKRALMIICLGLLLVNFAQSGSEQEYADAAQATFKAAEDDTFARMYEMSDEKTAAVVAYTAAWKAQQAACAGRARKALILLQDD